MCPADGGRAGLAQTDGANFALLDEAGHGTHRVLDGDGRVDAVHIVQIDRLKPQALQAGFARRLHILGSAIHAVAATLLLGLTKLGGQDDLVSTTTLQGTAEQLLVVSPAVHVGRVQKIDATVQRVVDHSNAVVVT